MSADSCTQCKYFDAYDHDGAGAAIWGSCRRYPPILHTQFSNEAMFIDELHDKWRQPLVTKEDWCGEFKAETVSATPPAPSEQ